MAFTQPEFRSVQILSDSVEQFGLFQIQVQLDGAFINPYDYDDIHLQATFTGPGNEQMQVDGFFLEDFDLQPDGNLTPTGSGFQVRFSPPMEGAWTWQLRAKDASGESFWPMDSFEVVASEDPGIIRTGQSNYLEFNNGEAFIPIGENICWHNNNPYLDYRRWLDSLSAHGGNYFRLWHAHWGLGIEWKAGWNGFAGLRQYHQENGHYQDWLFEYCRENGLYAMLCMQHHGQVSTEVNPEWKENPYNAANGGPCNNPLDFFTHPQAIALTKNRLRYIVARWGYASSIMAWELFNEVDWTDDFDAHQADIMLWHAEMAAFLKSIDPYQHLVTTSFAKEENDPLVWGNTDIDFTQTHHYLATANLERTLALSVRSYLDDFGKPTLTGEFGTGSSGTLRTEDPDGIHIHNGMWGSLMAGGLGTAMSWWWDTYIEPQDLYYHFDPISEVVKRVPFAAEKMAPVEAVILDAPGALDISPTRAWGVVGEDTVTIQPDGSTVPESPALSVYLYGNQWNTDFRSPPVFTVEYPVSGTFSVTTAATQSESPRIAIWVDGVKQLDESAAINQSYSVEVPAGEHHIRVDNPGKDWITISNYSFSGLGSALDAWVLQSAAGHIATGWVLNRKYHWLHVPENGPPDAVSGAKLLLTGLADSSYFLKWIHCLTGAVIANVPVTVVDGALTADIPLLIWDLAFVLDGQPEEVTAPGVLSNLVVQAFPNPARRGSVVTIRLPEGANPTAWVELLDMSGRILFQTERNGSQEFQVQVPETLAAGMYWWRIRSGNRGGAVPVLVQE